MIASARQSPTVADELAFQALPEETRDLVARIYGLEVDGHGWCYDDCECYERGYERGHDAAEDDEELWDDAREEAREEAFKELGPLLAQRVRAALVEGFHLARKDGAHLPIEATDEEVATVVAPERLASLVEMPEP